MCGFGGYMAGGQLGLCGEWSLGLTGRPRHGPSAHNSQVGAGTSMGCSCSRIWLATKFKV